MNRFEVLPAIINEARLSLDGTTYCYRNPLAFDPAHFDGFRGSPNIRNPWYDVTCCPPNIERTFSSLPGYFYSTSKDGVYVHLYDNSTLDWHLEDGSGLKIQQKTNYPWDGAVKLSVSVAESKEFTLYARIPGWAANASAAVNGTPQAGAKPGEYLAIRRTWRSGDIVNLNFPMNAEVIASNPRVAEDRRRVGAVETGQAHRATAQAGRLAARGPRPRPGRDRARVPVRARRRRRPSYASVDGGD